MKPHTLLKFFTPLAIAAVVIASFQAFPEDIDIFSVDEGNNVNAPNVLIVLDNSANWSRQAQQWPEAEQQGQSEVAAIREVINDLDDDINVGLFEFITSGSAADQDAGFVRQHIRPMTTANKASLTAELTTIYGDINGPTEKRPQSNPFGTLYWDVYNYLGGIAHSNNGNGTLAAKADESGYSNYYATFHSPLTAADTCTRTILIFIGNNVSSGPSADSDTNVTALKALAYAAAEGTDTEKTAAANAAVAQIPFADYVVSTSPAVAKLGYTPKCYSAQSSCNTAVNVAAGCTDEGFTSCSCDAADFVACPKTHWSVVASDTQTTTTTIYGPATTVTAGQDTGDIVQTCKTSGQAAALNPTTCPGSTDVTQANTPVAGQSTRTQTSWASCSYVDIGAGSCSPSSKHNYQKRGTRTQTVTVTQTTTTTTQTNLGETAACYDDQPSCSTTGFNCSGYNGGCACTAAGSTTGCGAGTTKHYQILANYNVTSAKPTGTYHAAPTGPFMLDEWARFLRQTGVLIPGNTVRTQVTTYTIDVFNAQQHPDFSALLFNAARVGGGKYFQAKDKNAIVSALREIFTEVQAVNSAFSSASLPINATNRTQNENQVYIGVFKPDRSKDPQWFGNLKRFQIVRSGADIALGDSVGANAINNQTGFLSDCAVSYWTTDSGKYWATVITDDPDALSICQTNSTSDSSDSPDGPFVEKGAIAEVIRKGNDPGATADGAGNYVLNRNVYTLSGTSLVKFDETSFDDGDAATSDAQEKVITDFIRGEDIDNDDLDSSTSEPRSTVHGDVVHSRPQPINYGDDRGVVIFYGANDGHFRAISSVKSGGVEQATELWSFIAPEHFARKLKRLRDSGFAGNQLIKYFWPPDSLSPEPPNTLPKDYFFDGPTGTFQEFTDNVISKAMIFPTMRRGGRMIYAFDVTDPKDPKFKWKAGCPKAWPLETAPDDTGCADGSGGDAAKMANMGETWSNASVAFIKGYSTTTPVVITGGGYDTQCEDVNNKSPCAGSKGHGVFVFDAFTGKLLRFFNFNSLTFDTGQPRGVAADIALISVNPDKFVDYAYAADTGGNIYRLDFVDGPSTLASLAKDDWKFSRVAKTNGFARKFLFPPSLLQVGPSTVYLALGSGDREHPLMKQYPYGTDGDASSAVLNRFYLYKDDLLDVDASTATDLDGADMKDYSADPGCNPATDISKLSAKGWFMDLNDHGQGEQVVSAAVIAGGYINFSTNRPTPPETTACTTSLGEARGYFVNMLNGSGAIGVGGSCGGSQSSTFVGGGLPPSPVIATVLVGNRVETIVIGAVTKEGSGCSGALCPTLRNPTLDTKRRPVYWYKSSGDN